MRSLMISVAAGALLATSAIAQQQRESRPPSPAGAQGKGWVAPGTPGSPIDGTLFHAQVLLDAAGFSPGVIDGREGSSLKEAIQGFQQSKRMQGS